LGRELPLVKGIAKKIVAPQRHHIRAGSGGLGFLGEPLYATTKRKALPREVRELSLGVAIEFAGATFS
jgi:hypothetical protein